MSEEVVKKFLQFPYSPLVDTLVDMANLKEKEKIAVDLCVRKGLTQSEAAEQQDTSNSSLWRYYKSGMKKLCKAWSGIWWILVLVNENENKDAERGA